MAGLSYEGVVNSFDERHFDWIRSSETARLIRFWTLIMYNWPFSAVPRVIITPYLKQVDRLLKSRD